MRVGRKDGLLFGVMFDRGRDLTPWFLGAVGSYGAIQTGVQREELLLISRPV